MGNAGLMCPVDEKEDAILDDISQPSTIYSSRKIDKLSSSMLGSSDTPKLRNRVRKFS